MDTLPNEVLHHILDLTVEEVNFPASFINGCNPWTLPHVSSRFRLIALGSPGFWVNLTITIGAGTKVTQDAIRAVLARAQTSRYRLSIVWSLSTILAAHNRDSLFPRLDSSNPASALIENTLLHFCNPFSKRISSLSMLFRNVNDFEFARLRFRALPNKFFIGLSEIHLDFVSPSLRTTFIPVKPIFEERLFDTWTGVPAPKVAIRPWVNRHINDEDHSKPAVSSNPQSRSIRLRHIMAALSRNPAEPLLINLPSPETCKIAHLALTGIGLLQTRIEVYNILYNTHQLQTFTVWVISDSDSARLQHLRRHQNQVIHLPLMHTLNLTLCDTSDLPSCLAGLLDFIRTPKLTQLAISRHPRPSSNCTLNGNVRVASGILDPECRVVQFLTRCEALQELNVCGFAGAQDFETIQQLLPSLRITKS